MALAPAAPDARPASDHEPLWQNPWASVRYVDAVDGQGRTYKHTAVRSGSGLGALVIPRVVQRGVASFGFVEIDRPVIGATLVEFPRGGTSDLSSSEAARELVEETGITTDRLVRLGSLHPDTGLLDTEVGAWLATQPHQAPPHIDPETGSRLLWLTHGEVTGAIASGSIRCGMTLAAWAMFAASSHFQTVA